MRIVVVLIYIVLFSTTTFAEEIIVSVSDSGYAPFHMKPLKSGETVTEGIVIDILNEFQKYYPNYKIRVKGIPKIREQKELDSGSSHMTYNSPLFVGERAENYLWSTYFAKSKDCLVMLKKNKFKFEYPEDLFGKRVGKIRGFGYGEYDNYFKKGKIKGEDVTDSNQLIKMLKAKRVDCFIGNIYVTPYEIKLSKEKIEDFYFSDKTLYEFEFMFQINKNKAKLKEDLDNFIKIIKENGILKKIEEKYRN